MRVFVTGATGYIGRVLVERMRDLGHQALGLARSDASARKLEAAGVQSVRGDLRDTSVIARAARECDATVHLAMDFSAPDAAQLDRALVETVLEEYRLTARPFLYTSGIWVLGDTGGAEADEESPIHPIPLAAERAVHEQLVLRARGARGIVIRPGMVYGRGGGMPDDFARQAREQGVVRMVGPGTNRWPLVDVDDLADLYVLALGAPAGSLYFAAVGPSIAVREIAAAKSNGVPVESIPEDQARQKFGPLVDGLMLDQQVTAKKAMRELGWNPKAAPVTGSAPS